MTDDNPDRNADYAQKLYDSERDEVLDDIAKTLDKARGKHRVDIHSRHEGYAVVLEELDEVKECVWHDSNVIDLYREILHTAAMLVRMAVDLDLRAAAHDAEAL